MSPELPLLLRHEGRMRLLRQVLEHDERRTVCAVDTAGSALFAEEDGRVPSWLALEYMAQGIAAHAGLEAARRGEPAPMGLFLGARRVRLAAPPLEPDEELRVTVSHHRGERGLVAFDCAVERAGGAPVAEGRLHVYAFDGDPRELPGG